MKEISLVNSDKVALVDDEDYAQVTQHRWLIAHTTKHINYAYDGKGLYLHVLLMGEQAGKIIDHKDLDGLNNQRINMRFATRAQNIQNSRAQKGGASKYKGVARWGSNLWQAGIKFNYIRYGLGIFTDEKDAAKAYDQRALLLFGEFARTNAMIFPGEF
jgi:hypothetical protein